MKIHILYKFEESFFGGGGNQFSKALKEEWTALGVYENDIEKANVILFNSYHQLKQVFSAKRKFPLKVFIHRIDGPMGVYRPKEKFLDKLIFTINRFLADGTIFQSQWSMAENKKLFPFASQYQTVIYNAPDSRIFNKQNKKPFNQTGKISLIASSWSTNFLKGFDFYKYLDENLNF